MATGESSGSVAAAGGGQDMNCLILDRITALHSDLKLQINEINTSNKNLSEVVNNLKLDIKSSFSDLNKQFSSMKTEVDSLKKDNLLLRDEILSMKIFLNQTFQSSACDKLRIINVPDIEGMDVYDIIKRISDVIGFNMSKNLLDQYYRLKLKNISNGEPIIFKFVRFCDKTDFLNAYKQNKDLISIEKIIGDKKESSGVEKRVFISENMSSYYYNLYKKGKQLQSQRVLRFVWFRNNKLYVRQDEGSRAVIIHSDQDYQKFTSTGNIVDDESGSNRGEVSDYEDVERVKTEQVLRRSGSFKRRRTGHSKTIKSYWHPKSQPSPSVPKN